MYRTYTTLYRLRAELSSIGDGRYRISFPRGKTVNVDTVVIFVIAWPIATFTAAPILGLLMPAVVPHWILGLLIAGFGSFQSGKLPTSGKPLYLYLLDLIRFVLRPKFSDGWQTKRRPRSSRRIKMQVQVSANSKPGIIRGFGISLIEVVEPIRAKVRGSWVHFGGKGVLLQPGHYAIEKKIFVEKSPPPTL